jgi:hypothetical protein
MNRRHLLTLAAGVLLVAGCSAAPAGSDAASASSSPPAATSGASATADPTPRPSRTDAPSVSPSASPSDAPEIQLGYGAALIVGTAGDLLAPPSTTADSIGRVEAGERVVIGVAAPGPEGTGPVFGPVEADDDIWYPVVPESGLEPPHTIGWIPITRAGATLDDTVECPSSADAQLMQIVEMAPQERLACFGDDELELEGWMPLTGLGGMAFGTWEPMWLAYPVNDGTPLFVEPAGGSALGVFFAPDVTPPTMPSGSTDPTVPVRVVGHFDDSASASCVVQAPEADQPEPAAEVERYCRTHFVATEIELIDG